MTLQEWIDQQKAIATSAPSERWKASLAMSQRASSAAVITEDGNVVAQIPRCITVGGTYVHNRYARHIAANDPDTVLLLLDVVAGAHYHRHGDDPWTTQMYDALDALEAHVTGGTS